ncbi:hypothetical protein GP486_004174 [Trichoglossum hirsutum]|uniref:Uncharacterized protein n=1 Tax=Trichoglossum hirsutum TaxID=265104 RepID=A0A9P8LBQ6_9PEZI|nr:hypothetical protein GP486_004174 [Trichoglossum hirsutum]
MNGDVRTPQALLTAPTPPQPRESSLFSYGMPFMASSKVPCPSHQEYHPPFRFSTATPAITEVSPPTTSPQPNSQQVNLSLPHEVSISALDLQQTMSQILPPRRELPFAKPGHSGKPGPSPARGKARPLTTTLELPELPNPTFRSAPKGATTLQYPSQGDSHLEKQPSEKPPEKPPLLFKPRGGSSPTLSTIAASDKSEPTAFSAYAPDARSREIPSESRSLERPDKPQMPSDETISHPVARTEASSTQKYPFPQVPLRDEDMRYMDTFVQKHMHYEQPVPSNDLSRLAGLSSKDRQAEIDSMICDLIHDENFYRLLEAVENSWQRIGFDIRR